MINIDRLNRISETKRAEYISMLREFNDSFHEVEQVATEAIQYVDACEVVDYANQVATEAFGVPESAKKVGAAVASPFKKIYSAARTGVGLYKLGWSLLTKRQKMLIIANSIIKVAVYYGIYRLIKHFMNFNVKAKKVFKKFEEVIVPGKDSIDPEAFKASKAKLIHTDKYQVLFKTTGDLTKQIKDFMQNYTTKPIVWNKDMFHGMDFVTKTDKNGVEMIKEIKLNKDFKATKTTVGSAGWDLEKAFKLAPVIKAIIETTAEFKRYNDTLAADQKKLEAIKKSLKNNPEEQGEVVGKLLVAKANLADFNHVLKAYFSLIGVVCGQFFTLTAHMKVKKA